MANFTIGLALQVSFSLETLAAIDRLAGAIAGLTPTQSVMVRRAQSAASGVSAPVSCASTLEPAEGPSRAAGETHAGRPEKTPRSSSRGWLTPARRQVLIALWPTKTPLKEI